MRFFRKSEEEKARKAEKRAKKKEERERKYIEKQRKVRERHKKLNEKIAELENKQLQQKEKQQKILGVKLEHLGGYPKIPSGKEVRITKTDEPRVIKLGQYRVTVKGMEWDEGAKRSLGKAAVGSVAGTFLAGPVGTVAGAIVGGRRRDNSVLIMKIEDNGIEFTVYFRANQKEFQEISSFLY